MPIGMAFEQVAVDCLGPLPISRRGNKYIIPFAVYRTKWPEAKAVPHLVRNLMKQCIRSHIISKQCLCPLI